MSPPRTRRYHAPRRSGCGRGDPPDILRAAQEQFEAHGWAATTIRRLPGAWGAGPRPSSARSATKPALLEETLLGALRGEPVVTDTDGLARLKLCWSCDLKPGGRSRRRRTPANNAGAPRRWRAQDQLTGRGHLLEAVDSGRLPRTSASQRSGTENDRRAARPSHCGLVGGGPPSKAWASGRDLTLREAESTFMIAIDWNTDPTLTTKSDMSPEEARSAGRRALLPPHAARVTPDGPGTL